MNQANELLAQRRLQIAFDFVLPFGAVTLFASILGGLAAGALGAALGVSLAISFLGLIAGAVVIGYELLIGLDESRRIIIETACENVEQLAAQRLAVERAQLAQLNINAGSGQMTVKNKPMTLHVNGELVGIGSQVSQAKQIEQAQYVSIGEDDTFWLLERFAKMGLARGQHVGQEMPFSRQKVRRELYEALIATLIEGEQIKNRRQGYAGELVEPDTRRLMKVVKAKFPEGVKVLLPSTASQAST